MLRVIVLLATLLAVGNAGLLVDRGELIAQLRAQGYADERTNVPDRIAALSQTDLQRQKFILDLLQHVQQPLADERLLQFADKLISDATRYEGGIDSEMRFVLDLTAGERLLRKNETCRISNARDLRQYLGIYRLLARAADWETFQRNACYLRHRINAILFVDAFLLALRDRVDTQQLLVPAIYEILPELYYDEQLLRQARSTEVQQLALDAESPRRLGLYEVIAMGRRSRLISQTIGGTADPKQRSQFWMPWRELRLRAGRRQLPVDKRDNRVVLPVVRNRTDDMALLTKDVGFRAYLQSFIGELTLTQAEARAQGAERLPGVERAAAADNERLLRVGRRRRINFGVGDENADQVERFVVDDSIDEQRERAVDRDFDAEQFPGVNRDRQVFVNRRRFGNTEPETDDIDDRRRAEQRSRYNFRRIEDGTSPEEDFSDSRYRYTERLGPGYPDFRQRASYLQRERGEYVPPRFESRVDYRQEPTARRPLVELPTATLESERLLHVGRRRQSELRGNQAERFIDLIRGGEPISETRREGIPSERERYQSRADEQQRVRGRADLDLPTRSSDDERLLHVNRRRLPTAPSTPERSYFAARRTEQQNERGGYSDERDDSDEEDVVNGGQRRVKYDTSDELNRIRDQEREAERQRMREERDRAREERERERRPRYYADKDEDVAQRSIRYDTSDNMNRLRDQERDEARRRMHEERDRAREQRDREERRERGARYYADEDDSVAQRRGQYENSADMNRVRDQERDAARRRMREERERERSRETGARYYGDYDDAGVRRRISYENNGDMNRERNQERDFERQRMHEERDREREFRDREQQRDNRRQYYGNEDDEYELQAPRRVKYDTSRLTAPRVATRAEIRDRREREREARQRASISRYSERDEQSNVSELDEDNDRLLVVGRRRRVPRSLDERANVQPESALFQEWRNAELLTHNLQQLMARINMERGTAAKVPSTQKLLELSQKLEQRFRVALQTELQQRRDAREVERIIANVLIGRSGNASIIDVLGEFVQQLPEVAGVQSLSDAGVLFDEPAVQDVVNRVLRIIDEERVKIYGSYTSNELEETSVSLESVKVDGLRTFVDSFDTDLQNAIRANVTRRAQRLIVARQQRLNHKPFQLEYVINANRAGRIVVRTFLGPKLSALNGMLTLDAKRRDFMLLDAAVVDVQLGRNVLTHKSRDISWPARDTSTYTEIYQRVMGAMLGVEQRPAPAAVVGQSCRFPERLLLPRGRVEGLPMQLFTIVSRLDERVQQFEVSERGICGIGIATVKLDERSLGYPLDRRIDNAAQFLNMPNVRLSDVRIYHDEE